MNPKLGQHGGPGVTSPSCDQCRGRGSVLDWIRGGKGPGIMIMCHEGRSFCALCGGEEGSRAVKDGCANLFIKFGFGFIEESPYGFQIPLWSVVAESITGFFDNPNFGRRT